MNFKKILAMVLVVAMCFSMIPTYAFADGEEEHVHDYDAAVTEPTCEEQGYTTYTCTDPECGDGYVDDYTDALGHDYEVFETVDPTCDAEGYTVYKCSRCGATENSNFVAAKGHDFVDGACTVCGEADPDYVAPTRAFSKGLGGGGIVTAPRPQPAANIAYVSIEDNYAGTYYVGDMETFDYLNAALRAAGTLYSDDDCGPYGVLDTTVTMLRGFTLDEAFSFDGQTITLDLAGYTLTLGSGFSVESGKLIITGTGKLNGYDAENPQVSFANGYVYYNGSVVLGSTVTFDCADGSTVTTQPVANGQKAIKPADQPTKS